MYSGAKRYWLGFVRVLLQKASGICNTKNPISGVKTKKYAEIIMEDKS
jgi:hypothetical protein